MSGGERSHEDRSYRGERERERGKLGARSVRGATSPTVCQWKLQIERRATWSFTRIKRLVKRERTTEGEEGGEGFVDIAGQGLRALQMVWRTEKRKEMKNTQKEFQK